MSPKKKSEEELEEEYDEDEELEEDEEFECRVCRKTFTHEELDDNLMICDICAEKYNVEKIWNDFESDKIPEDELTTFDLSKYKL